MRSRTLRKAVWLLPALITFLLLVLLLVLSGSDSLSARFYKTF